MLFKGALRSRSADPPGVCQLVPVQKKCIIHSTRSIVKAIFNKNKRKIIFLKTSKAIFKPFACQFLDIFLKLLFWKDFCRLSPLWCFIQYSCCFPPSFRFASISVLTLVRNSNGNWCFSNNVFILQRRSVPVGVHGRILSLFYLLHTCFHF